VIYTLPPQGGLFKRLEFAGHGERVPSLRNGIHNRRLLAHDAAGETRPKEKRVHCHPGREPDYLLCPVYQADGTA
jgi:hypothetical protein